MTATTNDGFTQTTATGGETTIDFDFLIYAKDDMLVYETNTSGVITLLVRDTDYSIADSELSDPTGGEIVLDVGEYPSGATAGHKFTCISDIAETRSSDFQQGGDFFASTLNTNLDRLTRVAQQLRRDVDKAARPRADSLITTVTFTDDPQDGYGIVWDGVSGNLRNTTASLDTLDEYGPAITAISDEIEAVAAVDTEIAALGAITANITTVAAISASVVTAAGDSADIATVSGLSASITALAAIDTELAYLYANFGDISTVAAALAASIASGITFDDTGLDYISGEDVQEAFENLDTSLDDIASFGSGAATSGQYPAADGAGGIAWDDVPETSPAVPNGGYAANRYYYGGQTPNSTKTLTANRLYYTPFYVGAAETFTRIGVKVTTLHASSIRLGIYNMANGVPTTLVLDAGTVSAGTTGAKEATISQALSPGIYALALVSNGTATLTGMNFDLGLTGHVMGAGAGGDDGAYAAGYTAFTYAALTTWPGAVTYVTGGGDAPLMWLRKV